MALSEDRRTHLPEARFEMHRRELVGYCYRMLGSPFEAEDAVQETYLRAWRSRDSYDEERSSWKTWLFSIATHICIDMLRSAQRRVLAVDLCPAADGGPDFDSSLPDDRWVQPIADTRVVSGSGDPAELMAQRETIRLAFVAALQCLPPRQRAVLILSEVLGWRAAEVAGLLDTTTASVNSALQRARSSLADKRPFVADPLRSDDPDQQRLLGNYLEAFESHDIDRLVALLAEDATMSMPPVPWWVQGRETIGRLMKAGDGCRGDRLVPTVANGQPAFGQYRRDVGGRYRAFGLLLLATHGKRVTSTITYLNADRLFPVFGLSAIRRF